MIISFILKSSVNYSYFCAIKSLNINFMKKIIFIISIVCLLTSCDMPNEFPFYPKAKVEFKLTGSTNCIIQYTEENGGIVNTAATGNWSYSYKNEKGTYFMLHAKNLDVMNVMTGEVLINGKSKYKQVTSDINPYVDFSGKIE
jgi:hypothetical protein